MFIKTSCSLFIILLLAGGGTAALADEATHRQAVEKLFELIAMEQKIDESVTNILTMQLAQNPDLRAHETVVREFFERHIGWGSLVDPLTEMYLQAFSEQELNEMNAFYGSPTGRKVIEYLPELVQRRNQLAMQRLQENIGELQYEIEARQAKEQQ
jgi:hypothetical protein